MQCNLCGYPAPNLQLQGRLCELSRLYCIFEVTSAGYTSYQVNVLGHLIPFAIVHKPLNYYMLLVILHRDIDVGEEIFVNYTPRSNTHWELGVWLPDGEPLRTRSGLLLSSTARCISDSFGGHGTHTSSCNNLPGFLCCFCDVDFIVWEGPTSLLRNLHSLRMMEKIILAEKIWTQNSKLNMILIIQMPLNQKIILIAHRKSCIVSKRENV